MICDSSRTWFDLSRWLPKHDLKVIFPGWMSVVECYLNPYFYHLWSRTTPHYCYCCPSGPLDQSKYCKLACWALWETRPQMSTVLDVFMSCIWECVLFHNKRTSTPQKTHRSNFSAILAILCFLLAVFACMGLDILVRQCLGLLFS